MCHASAYEITSSSEERWQTIGLIGHVVVFVVHTWPEPDPDSGEEAGRIPNNSIPVHLLAIIYGT
jgi:hypothetical protein